MDWPRVPFPGKAEIVKHSAALGEALSLLLDPETAAPGITADPPRPGLLNLGLPTKQDAKPFEADDLALTAGWGSTQRAGGNSIVMPGRGLTRLRDYTPEECAALNRRPPKRV